MFEADGRYRGQDPVSPCPPGVQCIWSGIIDFRGAWRVDGPAIALAEEPAQKAGEFTRPPSLTMSGGSLYDPEGCRYDRR